MSEKMYYEEEPRGHVWVADTYGKSDRWQLDYEHHNGPRCVICDYTFCEHCAYPRVPEPCAGKSRG